MLKNVVWNVCVPNSEPESAERVMVAVAGTAAEFGHRINILPAYYCVWTPAQLHRLDAVLAALTGFAHRMGIRLENCGRSGTVPLFNDGPAVDADGAVYSSNLCMAQIPASVKKRLKYRSDGCRTVSALDLVETFGLKAVASSYAAGEILGRYV